VADEDVLICLDGEGSEFFALIGAGAKRRTLWPWLAAAALLLLLGAGGAAAWWFTRDRDAAPEPPPPAPSPPPPPPSPARILVERTPAPLQQRRELLREEAALRHGGSKESERAVASALAFLGRAAREEGGWDSRRWGAEADVDLALTGLALLAFLGAGQTAREGAYRDKVAKAAAFLLANQDTKTGRIWRNGQGGYGVGYTHAIGGLALAELAALDRDEKILAAARSAAAYSVRDHPRVKDGKPAAWRYNARQSPDVSVTAWFVMQLKAANEAGVETPREAWAGAAAFLEEVRTREKAAGTGDRLHLYGYDGPGSVTARRSAIGCLCRLYLDVSPGELLPALDWITAKRPPKWEDQDWYYWYYGMMVTFQTDPSRFLRWNEALRDRIVEGQVREGELAGSWDPRGEFKNWGRLFSTALAALCLEVYYRYAPKDESAWRGVK
jgi:hypothetical protein